MSAPNLNVWLPLLQISVSLYSYVNDLLRLVSRSAFRLWMLLKSISGMPL